MVQVAPYSGTSTRLVTASELSAVANTPGPAVPGDQYTPTLHDKFVSGAKGASLGAGVLGVTGAGLGTGLALLMGDVPVLAAAVPIGIVGALAGAVIGARRGVQDADHAGTGGKTPTLHEKFVSGGKCAALGATVATCGTLMVGLLAPFGASAPAGEIVKGLGVAASLIGGVGAGVGFDYGWNNADQKIWADKETAR